MHRRWGAAVPDDVSGERRASKERHTDMEGAVARALSVALVVMVV